ADADRAEGAQIPRGRDGEVLLRRRLVRAARLQADLSPRRKPAARAPASYPAGLRCLTRSSTTAGSASVDVSPRFSKSFAAILRRMRRMILPERVFGRPGAHCTKSGVAIGPISLRTQLTSSCRSSSVGSAPTLSVTYA